MVRFDFFLWSRNICPPKTRSFNRPACWGWASKQCSPFLSFFVLLFLQINTLAKRDMMEKLFILNRFSTFFTGVCSRFASFKMFLKSFERNGKVAIFTSFWFHWACINVGIFFLVCHFNSAILTFKPLMELLLVFFPFIDVIHVRALFAFLNISAAVGKMGRDLIGVDHAEAVFALLCRIFVNDLVAHDNLF